MSSDSRPTVICLTPVWNEAWILRRFLAAAGVWADVIVVADQRSDDGSVEIAREFPKVRLIANDTGALDEAHRQTLLIEEARKIPGSRVLMALDADEFVAADFIGSPGWTRMISSPPGTALEFSWANVTPGFARYWSGPQPIQFGYVDDGAPHTGQAFHSRRLPRPASAPKVSDPGAVVMHLQYTDWDRMLAKQAWYQCFERLLSPDRRAGAIYRQYSHMFTVPRRKIRSTPESWFAGYRERGIDLCAQHEAGAPAWEKRVATVVIEHGAATFAREVIWDRDLAGLARAHGLAAPAGSFDDPRGRALRMLHTYLVATRRWGGNPLLHRLDRVVEACLPLGRGRASLASGIGAGRSRRNPSLRTAQQP